MLKTLEGNREFKIDFEKSNLSFGIMAPIGEPETIQIDKNDVIENKTFTKYEFVNFSSIKGTLIEEKNFQVQDNFSKTGVLNGQVNLDRLPRARFTLKDDEYGKIFFVKKS